MVSKRTKSRRKRLKRGGRSKKEIELIGKSALEDEIDELEIGMYISGGLSAICLIVILIGLVKSKYEISGLALLFLIFSIIGFLINQRNLNKIKTSKHTKSRIYRAGIDKLESDKRKLADAKKYKAAYIDRQGRAFTLHRRKAKFSKKRKSRKSRK